MEQSSTQKTEADIAPAPFVEPPIFHKPRKSFSMEPGATVLPPLEGLLGDRELDPNNLRKRKLSEPSLEPQFAALHMTNSPKFLRSNPTPSAAFSSSSLSSVSASSSTSSSSSTSQSNSPRLPHLDSASSSESPNSQRRLSLPSVDNSIRKLQAPFIRTDLYNPNYNVGGYPFKRHSFVSLETLKETANARENVSNSPSNLPNSGAASKPADALPRRSLPGDVTFRPFFQTQQKQPQQRPQYYSPQVSAKRPFAFANLEEPSDVQASPSKMRYQGRRNALVPEPAQEPFRPIGKDFRPSVEMPRSRSPNPLVDMTRARSPNPLMPANSDV
eukprot:TRINITY_DN1260_c0_g1_i1.p1 TRINITY_DN1260_c0_g1~~TRINITY_DN1260_c0_g1_i1.p1  ORF type:complete len:330 (-),score=24.01 TRINITY_DN1260_c0_g1_i1:68-1057(-)